MNHPNNQRDLKKDISLIKEIINNSNVKDPFQLEMKFVTEHPELYDQYTYLIKKFCKGDDMSMLDEMLKSIKKINNGESKEKIEAKLGDKLAEKYLYPALNKNK
jgi:hypothetical protein